MRLLSWFSASPPPGLGCPCIPKPSTGPATSSCSETLGEAGVESVRVKIVAGIGCFMIYSLKAPSAGGMEDPSHPHTLGNQGIILLHCLLCLQDPHINALFLEVLQSWWRHLGRRKTMIKSGGKGPQSCLSAMRQVYCIELDSDNCHSSITQQVTSPKFGSEPQGVKKASKKLTEVSSHACIKLRWNGNGKSIHFGVSFGFKCLLAVWPSVSELNSLNFCFHVWK